MAQFLKEHIERNIAGQCKYREKNITAVLVEKEAVGDCAAFDVDANNKDELFHRAYWTQCLL